MTRARPRRTLYDESASAVPLFIRLDSANNASIERDVIVPAAGVSSFALGVAPQAYWDNLLQQIHVALDKTKGLLVLNFNVNAGARIAGIQATLSAAHDASFVGNDDGTLMLSDATTANSVELAFPNVVAGSTTITLTVPAGHSCAPEQDITDWRIDANVFSVLVFNCQ
jgi:hypothetical protein